MLLPQLNDADGVVQAGSDYINASYLNAGTDERCTIIAAQGQCSATKCSAVRVQQRERESEREKGLCDL